MDKPSVKRRSDVQIIRDRVTLDLPIALVLLSAGAIGLVVGLDKDMMSQVVEEQPGGGVKIGTIVPDKGQVRFKKAGSQAWQDLKRKANAAQGDVVFTGSYSAATLVLENENRIKIGADSLVVVRIEEQKKDPNESWFTKLSKPVSDPKANQASIEVQKGAIQVDSSKGSGAPVKLMAGGKAYTLENKGGKGAVAIEVGKDGKDSPVKFAATGGAEVALKEASKDGKVREVGKITTGKETVLSGNKMTTMKTDPAASPFAIRAPAATPPPPAEVQSPVDGAVFQTNEISLRWRPVSEELKTSVEIASISDPGSVLRPPTTRSGTSTGLPAGDYTWKVRTLSPSGLYSPWSSPSRFSVKGNDPRYLSLKDAALAARGIVRSPEEIAAQEKARIAAEAAARAKADAEARVKAEALAKAKAADEIRRAAVLKIEAEKKAKEEASRAALVRLQAENQKRAELEAKARAEAQVKAKADAEARARAMVEARKRAEEDLKRRAEEEKRKQAEVLAAQQAALLKAQQRISSAIKVADAQDRAAGREVSGRRAALFGAPSVAPAVPKVAATPVVVAPPAPPVAAVPETPSDEDQNITVTAYNPRAYEEAKKNIGMSQARIMMSQRNPATGQTRLTMKIDWPSIPGATQYNVQLYKAGAPYKSVGMTKPSYLFVVESAEAQAPWSYRVTAVLNSGSQISGEVKSIGK